MGDTGIYKELYKELDPLLEENKELTYDELEKLKPELEYAEDGLYKKNISKLYYEFYTTRIGEKALTNMLNLLQESGLLVEENDPNDKRRKKIYSPTVGGEKMGN